MFFIQQLTYLTKIFGTTKQRNIAKAVSKLVDALISPECLSKFTWTGKTSIGKKEKFKDLTKIHDVVFKATKKVDCSLDFSDFKRIMVDSVMKYAHEKDPENKKRKKMVQLSA